MVDAQNTLLDSDRGGFALQSPTLCAMREIPILQQLTVERMVGFKPGEKEQIEQAVGDHRPQVTMVCGDEPHFTLPGRSPARPQGSRRK